MILDILRSQPITEAKRQELLKQSKKGLNYKDKNINRWDNKRTCIISNTVKDYNKIDMNTFWKQDKLKFTVKVKGETDDYEVEIEFTNIHPRLQQYVKQNRNKFDRDIVTRALLDALNSSDVKLSCSCPDFFFRFSFYASKEGYKSGPLENRPADISNPDNNLGKGCKHVLAVLNNTSWIRNIGSVIVNYANYCRDNLEYNYSRFIFPKIYGLDYKKAIQMCIDDFDENGELKADLTSDERIINLSNAIAKARFKGNKKKES